MKDSKLKEIFNYLDYFKEIRNIFAHSMNPIREIELKNTDITNMPFTKIYKWEDSELTPYEYSVKEIQEIETKLLTLKQLLALLDGKLRTQLEEVISKIISNHTK